MSRRGPSAPRRLWLQPIPSPDLARTPRLTTPGMKDRFLADSPSGLGPTLRPSFNEFGDRGLHGKPKVGKWLVFLASMSLLLLAMAVGFLSWLWFGDRDATQWRRLMAGPYNARSITLTSVLVRYAIATLAWITIAMMASVIVERHGVPRESIAEASIARYTGSISPLAFRPYALKASWLSVLLPLQLVCGIASQFTSSFLFSDVDEGLVRGFSQQGTAFYDFQPTFAIGDDGEQSLTVDDDSLPLPGFGWDRPPQTSEVFAEYAEPENRANHPRVDDTGPVWRAFLPIENAALRSAMTEYNGIAKVFDARVVCTYPNITSLSLSKTSPNGEDPDAGPVTTYDGSGTFDIRPVPGILKDENDTVPFHFSCPIFHTECDSITTDSEPIKDCPTRAPVWARCRVDPDELGFFVEGQKKLPSRLSSLEPVFYKVDELLAMDEDYYNDPTNFFASAINVTDLREYPDNLALNSPSNRIRTNHMGAAFLLIDLAEPPDSHPLFRSQESIVVDVTVPLNLQPSTEGGHWQILRSQTKIPPNLMSGFNLTRELLPAYQRDITVDTRVALCFDVTMAPKEPIRYFDIRAISDTNRSEPRQNWIQNESRYNITGVLRQLGALDANMTTSDRGIFSMTKESIHDIIEKQIKPMNLSDIFTKAGTTSFADYASLSLGAMDARNIVMCPRKCFNLPDGVSDYRYLFTVDPYWSLMFSRVIEETNSPALAIQAINTAKARMDYMGWLSAYTETQQAAITMLITAQVPTRVSGFAIVMFIIGAQAMLFVISAVQFRKTRNTVLNNAWMVVSQVSSSVETADILAQSGTMTDDQVGQHVVAERERGFGGEKAVDESSGQSRDVAKFVARDGTFRKKIEHDGFRRRVGWRRVRFRGNSLS